jgi:hypothetical protein
VRSRRRDRTTRRVRSPRGACVRAPYRVLVCAARAPARFTTGKGRRFVRRRTEAGVRSWQRERRLNHEAGPARARAGRRLSRTLVPRIRRRTPLQLFRSS